MTDDGRDSIDFDSVITIDVNEAKRITDAVLNDAERTNNDSVFLKGYYYRTLLDVNSGLTDRVIIDSKRALDYSALLHENYYKHKLYTVLGKFYVQQNDFTKALNYYLKAKDYFEAEADLKNLAVCYNGLGILYFEMGDFQNCIANFNKTFDIYNKTGNTRGKGIFYANMGNVYNIQNDYSKAKTYQYKALSTFSSLKDTVSTVSCMINISNIDSNLKNFDSSFQMLNNALKLAEQINNERLKERILFNIALIYDGKKDFVNARKYLEQDLELSRSINYASGELDVTQKLSEIAKKEGNLKEYAELTQSFYKLKDSIYGSEVKQKIEELKWANEFEKSELEKNLLRSKYEVEKERGNYLTVSIVLTAIASILGLGFIWLLYRNNKKNLQISNFENDKLHQKVVREHINLEREQAENEILKLKSSKQEVELESKNREITSMSIQLIAKNKLMSEISDALDNSKKSKSNIEADLKSILFQNQNQEKDWEQFKEIFVKIHPRFFDKIALNYPQLSATDIRICAYIRIRMSPNAVAGLLNISLQSLHTSRYRIRKKLNLEADQNLDDFIISIDDI
ncbi:tetratricopeptide repeat protein [Flavobacterium psychrotrophum]|uniref:tetratricopeptide repeat protein n=1 Tax=Flavobacterium psychrotrophum TaxID=2294119 RepID=UPI0013C50C9E|nr:tetratricopeptide repeat protein [Flavobacterium psychrotrophum]